jgi:mxaJ protein
MRIVAACLVVVLVGCGHPQPEAAAAGGPLRVCADPNNLPFTNLRREGLENRLAELLARDLGTTVEYTWWAQRRGFLRNTLDAGRCDVVMGLPSAMEMVETTRPYYRSSYVFVTRAARGLDVTSFDDERLRHLRIGVSLVSDDGANAPPAHALGRRGLAANVVGYSVYGDYRRETPPSDLIAAVARGEIDIAAAWGPLAGYFARRQTEPLTLVPMDTQDDGPSLPLAFDISMAVRRGDASRLRALDDFIARRRSEIDRILAEFHVPRVEGAGSRSDRQSREGL